MSCDICHIKPEPTHLRNLAVRISPLDESIQSGSENVPDANRVFHAEKSKPFYSAAQRENPQIETDVFCTTANRPRPGE